MNSESPNSETPSSEDWTAEQLESLRLLEAALFAASEPLDEKALARLPGLSPPLRPLLEALKAQYDGRGVQLERSGSRWAFRTAADLAPKLEIAAPRTRKPSRAALETLAIIAYHQPVTRGGIEAIRGVAVARGTLDTLLEAGWIAPRGRRDAPGRPLQWATSAAFLDAFGLESLQDLPGQLELKSAGLLDPDVGGTPLVPGLSPNSTEPEPSDSTEPDATSDAVPDAEDDLAASQTRDPYEAGAAEAARHLWRGDDRDADSDED